MYIRHRDLMLLFVAILNITPAVHGFLEGLYCGRDNCYDGKLIEAGFFKFSTSYFMVVHLSLWVLFDTICRV
jgi:hypothetical protein